jgi:hypothetical protein
MSTSSSRFSLALVLLILGAAAGWLLRELSPVRLLFTPRGTHAIVVGNDKDDASVLSIPKISISKTAADVLFWTTKKKDRQLWIEMDDDIFENTKKGTYAKFRVQCQGRSCFSGDIKPNAPQNSQGSKYWQVILDSSGNEISKADGWIIVKG